MATCDRPASKAIYFLSFPFESRCCDLIIFLNWRYHHWMERELNNIFGHAHSFAFGFICFIYTLHWFSRQFICFSHNLPQRRDTCNTNFLKCYSCTKHIHSGAVLVTRCPSDCHDCNDQFSSGEQKPTNETILAIVLQPKLLLYEVSECDMCVCLTFIWIWIKWKAETVYTVVWPYQMRTREKWNKKYQHRTGRIDENSWWTVSKNTNMMNRMHTISFIFIVRSVPSFPLLWTAPIRHLCELLCSMLPFSTFSIHSITDATYLRECVCVCMPASFVNMQNKQLCTRINVYALVFETEPNHSTYVLYTKKYQDCVLNCVSDPFSAHQNTLMKSVNYKLIVYAHIYSALPYIL